MKLSKYAKLVKQGGLLHLCHVENSGVWLGTRSGFYKATGLPKTVDAGTILTILDFDSKTMDKIVVKENSFESVRDMCGLDLSDDTGVDIEAKKIEVAATYKGVFATALLCEDDELIFYDEQQLIPLADVFKESEYVRTVVRRSASGGRYVVIRNGFDTEAGIMPLRIIDKDFLGDLADFQARCTEQFYREENREIAAKAEVESGGEQTTTDEMEGANDGD